MKDNELNYITIPRRILWDWQNNLISTPERNLLFFLRANGIPLGFCSVDMDSLARDTFNNPVDKSYINKLLLSLKSKRYIWYPERKGHRGTFQIKLDTWLMKDGTIQDIGKYFEQSTDRGEKTINTENETEDGYDNVESSQRIAEIRNQIKQSLNGKN